MSRRPGSGARLIVPIGFATRCPIGNEMHTFWVRPSLSPMAARIAWPELSSSCPRGIPRPPGRRPPTAGDDLARELRRRHGRDARTRATSGIFKRLKLSSRATWRWWCRRTEAGAGSSSRPPSCATSSSTALCSASGSSSRRWPGASGSPLPGSPSSAPCRPASTLWPVSEPRLASTSPPPPAA
jgi:hypothetical protein